MLERLVVAQINLSHFASNFSSVKNLIGPKTKMMAVVKANAYGHGAVEIAKCAEKIGADYLGVACLYEAKQLRDCGIQAPILILGYSDSKTLRNAVDLDLSLNIMGESLLKDLDKFARRENKVAKVHVKIDTGMHRLGLMPEEAIDFIPRIENYKNIKLEGIFSHFATSDGSDLSFAKEQLNLFKNTVTKLKKKGVSPPIHISNSAATLRLPQSHLDMVRPGIILYGLPPSLDFKLPFIPKPVLTLKTKIVQIRLIHKGESVGYGRTFKAQRDTLVAALPVGYADGFRRAPKNWGNVLVQSQKAPLLGRVSMDQSSIDVTHMPGVKVGEEVVLIGKQGQEEITARDVENQLGTIGYEVLTGLSSRVSYIYV